MGGPRNDTEGHGKKTIGAGARRGFLAKTLSSQRGWRAGVGHGMTRMITEGGSVVLVLSAAVLVIVIDARDGLGRGGARRGSHGDAEARRFLGGNVAWVGKLY